MRFQLTNILLLLLTWVDLSAQSRIEIHTPFETPTGVVVSKYADYITYEQEYLILDSTNQEGVTTFTIDIDRPSKVLVEVADFRGQFLVEPNQQYWLTIPADYEPVLKAEVFEWNVDSASVPTNQLSYEIDGRINEFLQTYAGDMVTRTAGKYVRRFSQQMDSTYGGKNAYLDTYLKYSLAQMDAINLRSNTQLFRKYFENQPIEYDNEAYMVFFNQFFNDFFRSIPPAIKDDMIDEVKTEHRLSKVDSLLSTDFRLKDEQLRELVMIKGLSETWNNPDYNQNGVRILLAELSTTAVQPLHRKMAARLLKKFIQVNKGALAPAFSGLTISGDTIHHNEYNDRYTLIEFFESNCTLCDRERGVVKNLHKVYKRDIAFLSVCVDCADSTAFKVATDQATWPMINTDSQQQIQQKYSIFSYPQYAIIDPNGYILQYPAHLPSERLEYALYKLASQRTRKKSYLIIVGEE